MWLQLTKTETDTAVDVVVVVIIGSFTSSNVTSFMAERSRPSSVTRLGDFSKFLVTNILTNVGQTYIDFFDYFGNLTFQIKTVVATLWVTFGKKCTTFIFRIWSHCDPSETLLDYSFLFSSIPLFCILFCYE